MSKTQDGKLLIKRPDHAHYDVDGRSASKKGYGQLELDESMMESPPLL